MDDLENDPEKPGSNNSLINNKMQKLFKGNFRQLYVPFFELLFSSLSIRQYTQQDGENIQKSGCNDGSN